MKFARLSLVVRFNRSSKHAACFFAALDSFRVIQVAFAVFRTHHLRTGGKNCMGE